MFAIAITLLVLEIQIDPADFEHLWRALGEEWPAYLAYVTGFLTVGGVWLAHHELFTRLRVIDATLMRLNAARAVLLPGGEGRLTLRGITPAG